jgi:hypothetical protein
MEEAASQKRDWSSLSVDALAEILRRIKWPGHPSFGLVCRRWQSARALSPFYLAWITPLLLTAVTAGTTASFRYYSPYYHKTFKFDTKLAAPPGAKIFYATGGLQLTLGSRKKLVIADIGTGAVCELPPTSRTKFDFVLHDDSVGKVYGVKLADGVDVSHATRLRNGEWSVGWEVCNLMDQHNHTFFAPSPECSPVLHDGSLYIMGTNGQLLLVHNLKHGRRPQIFGKHRGFRFKFKACYLFESDQRELMAVMVGHRGTPVNIVKLNKRTMDWEKTESLHGSSLFTGTPTTMMKRTNIKWMQDKIFLPRLFDRPETIVVDLVQRDNELAFVPKLGFTHLPMAKDENHGIHMWTCELGHGEEARSIWGAKRVDNNSIWVDFGSSSSSN